MSRNILHFTSALVFLLLHTGYVIPQTTEFTYQGSITSAGTPATAVTISSFSFTTPLQPATR